MKARILILCIAAAVVLAGCKNQPKGQDEPTPAKTGNEVKTEQTNTEQTMTNEETTVPTVDPMDWSNLPEEPQFKIETSEGTIIVKLYGDTPLHKANFMKLAKEKFYDGILFHRVINGFMVQVGDPLTKDSTQVSRWGTGGPGYTIPAEILPNHSHKKGALAAARRGDSVNPAKESSGSQFYIVQDEEGCRHLDGEYTIFGETVSGLDVIDKIASRKVDGRGKPEKRIEIFSVTPIFE
jgi:Peptidyl-prolyl cis-trans isomerase (rotamase) - cyclophilin family